MAVLETSITEQILKWFNKMPNGRAIKLHSSAYQGRGEPDVVGCIGGRMICIEVKRPGEKPKLIQEHIRSCWEQVGAIAIVATSLDDVKQALHEHRRDHAAYATTAAS